MLTRGNWGNRIGSAQLFNFYRLNMSKYRGIYRRGRTWLNLKWLRSSPTDFSYVNRLSQLLLMGPPVLKLRFKAGSSHRRSLSLISTFKIITDDLSCFIYQRSTMSYLLCGKSTEPSSRVTSLGTRPLRSNTIELHSCAMQHEWCACAAKKSPFAKSLDALKFCAMWCWCQTVVQNNYVGHSDNWGNYGNNTIFCGDCMSSAMCIKMQCSSYVCVCECSGVELGQLWQ